MLLIQQTRDASVAFAQETAEASVAFADRLTEAGTDLFSTVSESAVAFGKACRAEALDWSDLSIKTRDAYLEALTARMANLEKRAQDAQRALEPTALETKVLKVTHDALDGAQKRVEARLDQAEPKPSAAAKPSAKARPATKKSGRAPIRNYDQLTAKDVVGRIQRLSGPQTHAILDYEKSRKNRATVIRAAKQRLAAS
ncbi:MAG: hypothetical protein AAF436_08680 [Myxococcota bacterium]